MRDEKNSQPRRSGGTALNCYLSDIREYRVLDRAEEAELARAAKDERPGAFERLIEANLRFVVKVAHEYRHMGLPVEDLINEGNLGLIEAARRYDPERGVRFISWAVWWIRRSMREALSTQTHVVRLPGSQIKRLREVRETTDLLTKELGRQPEQDELAVRLSFDPAKLAPVHAHGIVTERLDDPISDDDPTPSAAILEDEHAVSAEDALMRQEAVSCIREACEGLNPQEKTVVAGRFGLVDDNPATLGAVGQQIGRSRERVRQIERRAMERLRQRYHTVTRRPMRFHGAVASPPATVAS